MDRFTASQDRADPSLTQRALQLQWITKELCARPPYLRRLFHVRIFHPRLAPALRRVAAGLALIGLLITSAAVLDIPLEQIGHIELAFWSGVSVGASSLLVLILLILK